MSGAFKKIASAAAAAFSVKAVVSFGQQAVSLASDVQEVQNVVDTAFGNMSSQVDEWAKTTVDKFGMSALSAKQTASTYMAMSKGMGMYGQAAADMAMEAAERTGDIASFYNMTQQEADTLLKSIWTGETESLKRIGVVMTQTNLNAYAMAKGIGKTVDEMTQAEQVQLRYQYVMEQTNLAAGDFAKTSGSWANQTRLLSEQWKEFMTVIGNGLVQVLTPVVQFLNECLSKLISISQQVYQVVSTTFGWDTDKQENSAAATSAMADAQSSLADATAAANEEAKKAQSSFDELNILSSSTTGGSTAVGDALSAVTATSDTSSGDSSKQDQKIPTLELPKITVFDSFVAQVKKGIAGIDFSSIKQNCEKTFASVKPIAKSAFNAAERVTKSSLGTIGTIVSGVVSVSGKAVQTMSGGVASWLEKDKERIAAGISQMGGNVAIGFDNISKAAGNIFDSIGQSLDRNRPQMEQAISSLLSGVTNFGMSVRTILTDGFAIATQSVKDWTEENRGTLDTFFDNLNQEFTDLSEVAGSVFSDMGTSLSDFWNGGGRDIFKNFTTALTDIGGKFVEIYNKWIHPIIDKLVTGVTDLWNTHLKPLWDNIVSFVGSVIDCVSTVWNNFLSPIVSWLIQVLKPIVMQVINAVWSAIETVSGIISDVVSGILKALGGLLDFITGIFSGNWEKAWTGICDFFGGIYDAIWGIIKGFCNIIIDGLNFIWGAIYSVVAGIVNGIGGIAGAIGDLFGQDWSFEMPAEPPLIPKLAEGGLAYGATVAMIGEGRYDEAVLPLSSDTYQRIADGIDNSRSDDGEQVALLREQNNLLRKIADKDPTVKAVLSTSEVVGGIQRKNRRDGKTTVPVG